MLMVTFRVAAGEYIRITRAARRAKQSRSEFIRNAITRAIADEAKA